MSKNQIQHYNFTTKELLKSEHYIPKNEVVDIILTSGASCPDTVVEDVLEKILTFFPDAKSTEEVLEHFEQN